MSSTLSEIATVYGITNVTAKSRLVNLGMWDGHAKKEGRRYLVDDEAVAALERAYRPVKVSHVKPAAKAQAPASKPQAAPASEDLVAELRDMVAYLKAQLAQKDDLASRQLAEKDEQIARRDEQISQLIGR